MDQDETTNEAEAQTEEQNESFDPAIAEAFMAELESQQNLPMGIVGGVVAALIGAAVWAGITVMTEYQIGWMAIGVGLLAGYAVRLLGKGISSKFGIVGVVCALLGCVLGNLFSACGFLAIEESVPFFDIVIEVLTNPGLGIDLLAWMFSPMDILFYAIAGYEGYKLSFREFGEEDLATISGEQ